MKKITLKQPFSQQELVYFLLELTRHEQESVIMMWPGLDFGGEAGVYVYSSWDNLLSIDNCGCATKIAPADFADFRRFFLRKNQETYLRESPKSAGRKTQSVGQSTIVIGKSPIPKLPRTRPHLLFEEIIEMRHLRKTEGIGNFRHVHLRCFQQMKGMLQAYFADI